MKLPVVRGTIDRRILANYRIDPVVMKAVLPQPVRPKIMNGFAVGGICLIRLKSIRPGFFPFRWGIGSQYVSLSLPLRSQPQAVALGSLLLVFNSPVVDSGKAF
jgi:hypothetical protein